MNRTVIATFIACASFTSMPAFADSQAQAISECKNSIRSNYDVSNFRNVFAEKNGHHRYRVYGKVGHNGHRYPFNCSVKRGWVQSYHYDGPYGGWDNSWKDSDYKENRKHEKHDRNVAIGVGLAALAVAAIAASSKSGSNSKNNAFSYEKNVDKQYLEDECGESLGGRIRREHHGVRKLEIDYSRVEHSGSALSGKGLIHWQQHQPSDVEFNCSFDQDGRVIDSSYSYY